MGLSSPEGAPSGASHEASHAPTSPTPSHDNFGQIFSHILEQKYPIAGGLAHMVFGGGPSQTPQGAPPVGGMATAPLMPMPTGETQQPDMIAANAKPPENSGVKSMIMKLLMG